MDRRFAFERNPPVMEALPPRRPRLFHFRVHCAGAITHDVQAANEDDARHYVKRRSSARVKTIEAIGPVATRR